MDFDAKIQWKPGMAMTASVLRHRDEDVEERMRVFCRTVLGNGRSGLLPGFEFHAWGAFSGKVYEMMGLKVSALLPSGRIIHICEDLRLTITSLRDGDYFLVLGVTDRMHEFEADGIPYSRPEYELSVRRRDEIDDPECMPIKRFIVEDGILNVDEEYIPPVLTVCQNEVFGRYLSGYADALSRICEHPNMVEGDWRRTFLRFMFRLKSFNDSRSVSELVQILMEVAEAVDYFIADGPGCHVELMPEALLSLRNDGRRVPLKADISTFLKWLDEYLNSVPELMDRVIIPDESIDWDQFRKDISDELYERLRTELSRSLHEELHSRLVGEITGSVYDTVCRYIDENTAPGMRENLRTNLHDVLYPELYDALYEELSKLSYKPAEEEDTFNPVI